MNGKKVKILNVEFDNVTMDELLPTLTNGIVITPNVDIMMRAQVDADLYAIISKAEYVVCDSQIIRKCSKALPEPIVETICGSDLFPRFCDFHANNGTIKVFLLGSTEEGSRLAMEKINTRCGRAIVVGSLSPSMGFEKRSEENTSIVAQINRSGANVLAVGVGCPKQEKWIAEHRNELTGITLFFAIGATIDFEAGLQHRAPVFFRKLGMEWFYRFIREPRRMFKRYFITDPAFFLLFWRFLRGKYRNPFTILL